MTFIQQDLIEVYYHSLDGKQLMGRLLYKKRQIFFEYDADFIKTGLELSPFKLPLKTGVMASTDRMFEGLYGIFNDSLPDGWGRLLLDRKLMHLGINPGHITALDRLCFVGSYGMGALSYQPENASTHSTLKTDLDEINYEIQLTLDENDQYVDDLLALGGSSAGARPKILLNIDGEDWLIKFRSSLDPKDISAIEYAYHLMALNAGLKVPEAKLFPSRNGLGFFGVKRFDRKKNQRIHLHSVSGLLHADHREPSLDYESIMKATLWLTQDAAECEIQFTNAVFNVLSHNRDDHAKNFSFLMIQDNKWQVSPAYDLTFSSGPAGEHCSMVMGAGKDISQKNLLDLAAVGNIKQDKALAMIVQVHDAVQQWKTIASNAGVSKLQTHNIWEALQAVQRKILF